MPNLYNRPRPTVRYLLGLLRDRAPLTLLFFLAAFCLSAFVGASVDHLSPTERRILGGLAEADPTARPADLPWRYRAPAMLTAPLARLLTATRLFDHPSGGTHATEAAATLLQSAAAAYALTSAVALLADVGFKVGMCIRIGLLLLLTTCLASVGWRFGPAPFVAAAVAGTLKNAWRFRADPKPGFAVLAGVWLLFGCLVDQTLVLLAPLLVHHALPSEHEDKRSPALIVSGLLALGVLAAHWTALLAGGEKEFLLSQLGVAGLVRRCLGAILGSGSSVFLAAPVVVLAILGAGRLRAYDTRLSGMTLGTAGILLTLQLLLVRDPAELADPMAGYAALLPALAPAMAFGVLRLKETTHGAAVMVFLILVGLTVQGTGMLFDPEFPLRKLRQGSALAAPRVLTLEPKTTEVVALDRRFTPELSDPALSLACLHAYATGSLALTISLPDTTVPLDLLVDRKGLAPRPWVARLWHWNAAEESPVALLGTKAMGQRLLATAVSAALAALGMVCLLFLGVRLRRFLRNPGPGRTPP